jgi:hypothetical protein
MAVYLHDWAESGEAGMLEDFGIKADALDGAEVIVASYTYEDYSGDAYVLFRKDGHLYEVHGGHCSCYGLSESSYAGDTTTQWQPELVEREALQHRIDKGEWGPDIRDQVVAALAD